MADHRPDAGDEAGRDAVLSGVTVAVTGATGFVGSHIALELAARGMRVVGVVRSPEKGRWMAPHGVTLVHGDLTDRDSLATAFAGADVVVSNAALGSRQGEMADFERVNRDGTAHVFDAAHAAGVRRVVHISTVAVYRTRLYRAMTEDARPYDTERRRFNWSDLTTDWRYARTKTLAERVAWERARAHGIALTCLRPGPVYGSRDPKATADLVRSLDRRVRMAPTVGVPWVHAGDVAMAVVGALDNPSSAGRAYNVAGPPVSLYRVLSAMKRALDKPTLLVPVPVPIWVRFDTAAAERDLGFTARPLAEGIAEAMSDLRL
ncbi:MAG: SDR family NAD(P)-dependent oxidoreductase [Deltaproteobacteria bacterium]|nr:MAG: SDR family NAD(P)-dependent oxidoreductase [Deltaproteobacteria bacterium]